MNEMTLGFEDSQLHEIALAFQARSRSLKRKAQNFLVKCLKIDGELEDFKEVLFVEISLLRSTNSPRLQIKIWPDRWVSGVAYRRGNKSENWTTKFDGRISSKLSSKDFEGHVENFWDGIIVGLYRSDSEANRFWNQKLINGPIGIVQKPR